MKYTILAVDDEPANLQKLRRTFLGTYRFLDATSGEEAFEIVQRENVDLVIADQRMPRMSGVELLKRILRIKPDVMRIILTGYTEAVDLIEAINEGHVYRYITKPWEPDELRVLIRQCLDHLELERENRRLTEELRIANERLRSENRVLRHDARRKGADEGVDPVFASEAMGHVLASAARVAGADATVLITGETGTGKEQVARYLHRHSARAHGLFVAVNCGAIPRELVESEFFGYKKGAFSGAASDRKGYFQLADGGTLFLDEIGEAPMELQVKLLRVIQEGEAWPVGADRPIKVDVRIVASTNRDLRGEVAKGTFREDLYFRLAVISLRVPSLRERPEDVRMLFQHFLKRSQDRFRFRLGGVSEACLRILEGYSWPGNVRQLENEVERLVLMGGEGAHLHPEDLSPYILEAAVPRATGSFRAVGAEAESGESMRNLDLRFRLQELERSLIEEALGKVNGNRTHASRLLGITRQSLLERLKRLGITEDSQDEQG